MRAALAILLLGGCSFAFVSGPPAHPTAPVSCTESRALPIVDATIAGASLVGGIAGLAVHNSCDSTQSDCLASDLGQGVAHATGAVLLVTAAVFALSSLTGFSETSACRRASKTDR